MLARFDLRLGIDVGGTNTDAVILDKADRLLARAKRPTSADVISGIAAAIEAVLAGEVDATRITHVMLGTTHATNAVLELRRLDRVAVVRLGAPATTAVLPLAGWPADLRTAVSAGELVVSGGVEIDGREIVPLDVDALARFLDGLGEQVSGVAITSVFAPVSARHEREAERIVRSVLGDVPVSLSHQIGSLGLLERENATVLNAALTTTAREVADALTTALSNQGLDANVLFAQNNGTLMVLEHALRHPVLTIGSGPANSIRGAAYLTGRTDALVADVGGTSTDIGVLINGFPRESSVAFELGGIRTNFRMPDLVALAVGGGTVVSGSDGVPVIGPQSVGYDLVQHALVFGGRTPTLTDAAVLAGRLTVGDDAIDRRHHALLMAATARSDVLLEDAVDRMKVSRSEVPLIAVGGANGLVPDDLPGVSEVLRPDNADVANAIGAAIAHVSGQVDEVVGYDSSERTAALQRLRDRACAAAVSAGADPETVSVVDQEEIPLAYMTNPAVRVRVKAAGPMALA